MDVNKILQDLRAEREKIEEAIFSLERIARGRGKRRGRPPAWLVAVKNAPESGRGKRKGGFVQMPEAQAS